MRQPGSSRPLAGPASFHPIYPRLLCGALRARGVDLRAVLAAAGVTERQLDAAAQRVTLDQMLRLLRAARERCDDPVLALEWGAMAREGVHGAAGIAVLSCRNVLAALRMIARVTALRTTAVATRVVEGRRETRLEIEEAQPLGEARSFLLAGMAVANALALESLLGSDCGRLRIELPVERPPDPARWQRHFPGVVRFGATRLVLAVPSDLCGRDCPAADDQAQKAALRQCELEAMALEASVASRVAALVARHERARPGLPAAARELAMSVRSLSRALEHDGTSYRAIVEAARREAAARFLKATDLPIQSIADRLGYSDPSNFIRAFRRWFGCTPWRYRAGASSSPAAHGSARTAPIRVRVR